MAGKTAFIRTRIDPVLKSDVETMFHGWGITTTQAIDMFYKQIKRTRSFPLELRFNEETDRAIKEARQGRGVKTYKTSKEMFRDLGIRSKDRTQSTRKRGIKKHHQMSSSAKRVIGNAKVEGSK